MDAAGQKPDGLEAAALLPEKLELRPVDLVEALGMDLGSQAFCSIFHVNCMLSGESCLREYSIDSRAGNSSKSALPFWDLFSARA